MDTILVVGGSGGIGASFAKRFQSMGKQVIVTGRNQSKLNELKSSINGLQTYTMDMTDLSALPGHVEALTKQFPAIDTVWINGGIQYHFQLNNLSSHSDERVRREIDTNVTGPTILARHIIPFLLSKDRPTTFMMTSSGLGFVPAGIYPVYCPTKAFTHSFLVGLRQQVKGTKMNVIEIVPPRVETDLDSAHKDSTSTQAMPLKEFTEKVFEVLDGSKGENLREVGVGFSQGFIDAWRGSIGPVLQEMKLGG